MACRAAISRSEQAVRENVRVREKEARSRKDTAKIVSVHFEGTAEGCYNSKVPHGPSASAVLLRGIPPSESAHGARPNWPPVVLRAELCGQSCADTKWPGSSGGRAQP